MKRIYTGFGAAGIAVIIFLTFFVQMAKTSDDRHILADAETTRTEIKSTLNSTADNLQPIPDVALMGYPYVLSIPRINVLAPVIKTGLESDGKMAVPNNYSEVGLFNGGVQPGEQGTAILGAHVDNGGTTPGVFKHLKNLAVGDDIYVTVGGQTTAGNSTGKTIHFKVTALTIYEKDEKQTDGVFYSSNGAHLNLITCYGEWLPMQNTYAQRLVVFADRI